MVKIGVNGFGRIARAVIRIAHYREDVEVVAVNSDRDPELLAHLLKYDSLYGELSEDVTPGKDYLMVGDNKINLLGDRNPENLNWDDYDVEVVIEATGKFRDRNDAQKHLGDKVKRVVISAPGKNEDLTVVMGVNEQNFDPDRHFVLSNASCTTNCLAPLVKVLDENFGVSKGMMTTVHSYTMDQQLLDGSHKDIRRARAANLSIIPTTTGAAKAVSKVLPHLEGRLDGMAFRVPTPTVSTVDLVANLNKNTSKEEINEAFREASQSKLKGILDYTDLPLVSADYTGNPHSTIIDGLSTGMVDDNMVKVIAWYDNEWGYSERTVDLCSYISQKS
ncbi:type I glyceraldehyde-3-phosphate dehydrogenase [Natranaerobius thermophilus JW/NM-WN-LF]|uniref:Glyceraldehyde-3-phosphate dehydrogenase n=2 Tax=Natranaerobius TaxID=375928 RepID=B2A0W2_NATTJ|nr:type I glyceraldehyde-3-phosphate dehydrogenase [Natranaerobius thermophilus]ACB85992.1 glyceraldehyde-3-phosphate dehydrogenase [Natranaerobius thermophilus JW/NM-WN-LF]